MSRTTDCEGKIKTLPKQKLQVVRLHNEVNEMAIQTDFQAELYRVVGETPDKETQTHSLKRQTIAT